MRVWNAIRSFFDRIARYAEQLYTAKELRAIGVFLLIGLAVLGYRGGKRIYYLHFPQRQDSHERESAKQQDSLFTALSYQAKVADSLFFSLPEDSLLPPSQRKSRSRSLKGTGLPVHSIAINSATKESLVALPTIGPVAAERILTYRKERGRFRSLAELKNVRGIGEKRFEMIKTYIRLD